MALYAFRDTTDHTPLKKILPKEALNFDGIFFENRISGYRTISVGGRELFGNEATVDTVGTRNGGKYRRSRLPVRQITVTYTIDCDTAEEFRAAFNQMNQLLRKEQVKIWFNDEPDKYFIATSAEVDSVPQGMNTVVSTFTLVCADPYKYSRDEKVVDIASQAFKVLSEPVYDTFSGTTKYTFNLESLPLNYARYSGSQASIGGTPYGGLPAVRFGMDVTPLVVGKRYVVEFDVRFVGQSSVSIQSGINAGTLFNAQEIMIDSPAGQHVKYEFVAATATSNAAQMVVITDSTNSNIVVENYSLTDVDREFWYPNPNDTFTNPVSAVAYPFTQEMYDLINVDGGTITLGTGTREARIQVTHNLIDTFLNIFPFEMQEMTTAQRAAFVRAMTGKVYQKGILVGKGKVRTTNFDVSEPDPFEIYVDTNAIISASTGNLSYSIVFDPGVVKMGAISIGANAVTTSKGKTLVMNNEGAAPTDVDFTVINKSENGYLSFQGSEDNGAILVGNQDEIAGINYKQTEQLILDQFKPGTETSSGWTYGDAHLLHGRAVLPLSAYWTPSVDLNMLHNSNDFSRAEGGPSVTLTKTPNQTLTVGSETFTDATRITSVGGTNTIKAYLIPQDDPNYDLLTETFYYSTSIYIKNNSTNAIGITMPGFSLSTVTMSAGETRLLKFENFRFANTASSKQFQLRIATNALANNLDVTVSRIMLNRGNTVSPWVRNYQDGLSLSPYTNSDRRRYHPYQVAQHIKFENKTLFNRKRDVAYVDNWNDRTDINGVQRINGIWDIVGMRHAVGADSNGEVGAKYITSTAYIGIYNHKVNRRGVFEYSLDDGTDRTQNEPVATIEMWNGNASGYTNIGFYVRGQLVHTIKDPKFNDFTGALNIKKEAGGVFTFEVVKTEKWGPTNTVNVTAQFTYTDASEENTIIKGANLGFGKSGGGEIVADYYAMSYDLRKLNVPKYLDTPNVFSTNDICDITCSEYLVQTFVNSQMRLDIQDVGSKPIMLPVGLSQIWVDYSTFADPSISIQAKFRERWL